jgi:hypothetical protein
MFCSTALFLINLLWIIPTAIATIELLTEVKVLLSVLWLLDLVLLTLVGTELLKKDKGGSQNQRRRK